MSTPSSAAVSLVSKGSLACLMHFWKYLKNCITERDATENEGEGGGSIDPYNSWLVLWLVPFWIAMLLRPLLVWLYYQERCVMVTQPLITSVEYMKYDWSRIWWVWTLPRSQQAPIWPFLKFLSLWKVGCISFILAYVYHAKNLKVIEQCLHVEIAVCLKFCILENHIGRECEWWECIVEYFE